MSFRGAHGVGGMWCFCQASRKQMCLGSLSSRGNSIQWRLTPEYTHLKRVYVYKSITKSGICTLHVGWWFSHSRFIPFKQNEIRFYCNGLPGNLPIKYWTVYWWIYLRSQSYSRKSKWTLLPGLHVTIDDEGREIITIIKRIFPADERWKKNNKALQKYTKAIENFSPQWKISIYH